MRKMPLHLDIPCYGCKDRTAECHATCDKYKEFRLKRQEMLKEKSKRQENEWRADDHFIRSLSKKRRR
jgi:hypothetical protein